jgi:hypothetical protein
MVDAVEKAFFASLNANFRNRRCGHPAIVWGEASSSDELAGDFGNSPEGISTGNRRVFRLSAGNWPQISLGLFRQHRPICDMPTDTEKVCLSGRTGSDWPPFETALLTQRRHHPSGIPAIRMPSRIRLLPARNVGSLLSMSPRVRRMVKFGSSASPARAAARASSSDPTSARAAAN